MAAALIALLAFPGGAAQAEAASEQARKAVGYMSELFGKRIGPAAQEGGYVVPQDVETPSQRADRVVRLSLCPRRVVLYEGEDYTLVPLALDAQQEVVHSAEMSWETSNPGVVEVSSLGDVLALAPGQALVTVRVGRARATVAVEVRPGVRPAQTDEEYDAEHAGDCAEPQSSQAPAWPDTPYKPQTAQWHGEAAAARRQVRTAAATAGRVAAPAAFQVQGPIDGESSDTTSPDATRFNNAVGSPRFAAQLDSGARAVKTRNILGSYNYVFSAPVLSLVGRGLGVNLALVYNSQLWTKDSSKITFNYNKGWPAAGWTLGYGRIVQNYDGTCTGTCSGSDQNNRPGNRLLIQPDGTRTHLAQFWDTTDLKWKFRSTDGAFLLLNGLTGRLLYPDGTMVNYDTVNNRLLPVWVRTPNGDRLNITYKDHDPNTFKYRWAIEHIQDSLGRYINFHYDPTTGALTHITAPDNGGAARELVRIDYTTITLDYNFSASLTVVAPADLSSLGVVRRIYQPQTGRGFVLSDYSSYGMARKVASHVGMTAASDGTQVAYTRYNYTTAAGQVGALTDAPQYTQRAEWWEDKTDDGGNDAGAAETVYNYMRTSDSLTETHTETSPHNVKVVSAINKDAASAGFGANSMTEVKDAANTVLRRTTHTYTAPADGGVQLGTVEVLNEAGQTAKTEMVYGSYGRVSEVREYGFTAAVQRKTLYFYKDDPTYISERMLQLVRVVEVYNAAGAKVAQTKYTYDTYAALGGMEFYNMPTNPYPPNHDAQFNQSWTVRGNVTAVETFSSVAPEVSVTRGLKYDIFGNVVKAQVSCCGVKTAIFGTTAGSATLYSQPLATVDGEDGVAPFLKTSYAYHFYTGLVQQVTDVNNQPTTYEYDTALRLVRVVGPTGASARTEFDKDANGKDTLVYKEQVSYTDADGLAKHLTTRRWLDGAGRVLR
ncbi:MAG TPA: hypothetical protein VNO70_08935, partial [Blastocatellia bacterium]|nr:hypothetical protein [Blastocatellia bacterium]